MGLCLKEAVCPGSLDTTSRVMTVLINPTGAPYAAQVCRYRAEVPFQSSLSNWLKTCAKLLSGKTLQNPSLAPLSWEGVCYASAPVRLL